MDRRAFLRVSLAGSMGAAALGTDFWRAAYATPAVPGDGPYGSIAGREPDENGIILPEGFTSRVVARAGEAVAGTSHVWHPYPDGGAVFDTDDGWIYVSNSEAGKEEAGVGAVRFSADGEIVDAYRVLEGTTMNCAGGPTPWGTWLSCEEYDALDGGGSAGGVWECDPTGREKAVARPALGAFAHEAVAVDPERQQLYLTEDQPDGRLYRFTPSSWPSLDDGLLEVAYASASGRVSWHEVPDPSAASEPTRRQVVASSAFNGGEGIWFDDGSVYFTTKGDNRVRRLDCERQRMELVYDITQHEDAPLAGVDNITVTRSGDLLIAEDGGDQQLVLISREREVAPFLQVVGRDDTELTGPAFSPDGTRLYFSSMPKDADKVDAAEAGSRSPGELGITYEVRGPFRGTAATRIATDEALGVASGGGFGAGEAVMVGGTAVLAAGLSALVLRNRRATGEPAIDLTARD